MVSGVESREGSVWEAPSAPLLGDLAEGDTDLPFLLSALSSCACTDALRGCGSAAINFQHLQEPNRESPFGGQKVYFRICPLLPKLLCEGARAKTCLLGSIYCH